MYMYVYMSKAISQKGLVCGKFKFNLDITCYKTKKTSN